MPSGASWSRRGAVCSDVRLMQSIRLHTLLHACSCSEGHLQPCRQACAVRHGADGAGGSPPRPEERRRPLRHGSTACGKGTHEQVLPAPGKKLRVATEGAVTFLEAQSTCLHCHIIKLWQPALLPPPGSKQCSGAGPAPHEPDAHAGTTRSPSAPGRRRSTATAFCPPLRQYPSHFREAGCHVTAGGRKRIGREHKFKISGLIMMDESPGGQV